MKNELLQFSQENKEQILSALTTNIISQINQNITDRRNVVLAKYEIEDEWYGIVKIIIHDKQEFKNKITDYIMKRYGVHSYVKVYQRSITVCRINWVVREETLLKAWGRNLFLHFVHEIGRDFNRNMFMEDILEVEKKREFQELWLKWRRIPYSRRMRKSLLPTRYNPDHCPYNQYDDEEE